MDTTLRHQKAKKAGQRGIEVEAIKRRAQQWRLMDCDDDALNQMRQALTKEMENVETQLADVDRRFLFFVEKGRPLDTQHSLRVIERLSAQWERLNKHLQAVDDATLERQLRARLAQRLGSERRVNLLDGGVFTLIVIAVGMLLAELLIQLPEATVASITLIDTAICVFLIGDFFLRLSLSADRGWYFRNYWIDLVSSIPIVAILRLGRLVRITRFARLFRLLRLGRALRVLLFAFRGLDKVFKTFQLNLLKRSVLIALVLLVFGAISISTLEGLQDSSLQEMGGSLWWSFTTVVTGGFADLHNPTTLTGRLITAGLVLLGFTVTGIFTASLTSVLVEDDSSRIEHNQRKLQTQLEGVHQKLDLLSGETNEGLIAMEAAAQLLSNQTSRGDLAAVLTDTLIRDFECIQASVHLLDEDHKELVRLAHRGLLQVAPPERDRLDAHLTGQVVNKLLHRPDIAEIDLEPETELCVPVKGIALACPLVANKRILGVLHVVLPDDLARYYLYNRVPMTLAHHAAMAFFAADLAEQSAS